MLFHYTDDEEKNIDFQLWPLSTWSLHILPCLHGFSLAPLVSHIPKMCMLGELVCLNYPSLNKCGRGCECALQWKDFLSRVGFPLVPGDPELK